MSDKNPTAGSHLPEPDPIPVEPGPETGSVRPEPVKAASTPDPAPHPMPTVPVSTGRGAGFLPTLAGGILAAAAGAGVMWYLAPQLHPQPVPLAEMDALSAQLNDQAEDISLIKDRLETPPPAPDTAPFDNLTARVEQIGNDLMAVQSGLSGLSDRIGVAERRLTEATEQPAAATGALPPDAAQAINELRAELAQQIQRSDELSASFSDLQTATRTSIAEGAEVSGRAVADAIGARIGLAVEAGLPYQTLLDQAKAAGLSVPEALQAHAGGVPSLSRLRDDFDPAARRALEAANLATAGGGIGDRAAMFLRNQLGIRSLEPRDGNSPDAILSRMGAAVTAGQIDEAITQASALPPAGQEAMAAWLAGAKARQAALSAAQTLQPGN